MGTRMATNDREALAQAIIELTAERGYHGLSVAAISRRAGISHYRFAEHFESVQDCYLRTFEDRARRFESEVIVAFNADSGAAWRERLRAAAYAAASFVDRDPATARFATVAMPGAGEDVQRVRDAQTQRLVGLLDAGRSELSDPDSLGRGHAEVLFGGIYQMLVSGLAHGERRPAVSFVPELMYLAVVPYLGHAAAHEELGAPVPTR